MDSTNVELILKIFASIITKAMATTIKTFPTLYNTTIGTEREKQWSVEVLEIDGEHYIVRAQHGVRGGKLVIHDTDVNEGKNIGKSNATNPRQQAILEAERDWAKKMKQGYAPENKPTPILPKKKLVRVAKLGDLVEAAEEQKTKDILEEPKQSESKLLKPMLALELDLDKPNIKYPVYIQPKLDGVRCLVYMNGFSQLVFQSRQNTIYEPFEHLVPELTSLFSSFASNKDLVIDGELYIHGAAFEKITSIVRRAKSKHPEVSTIKYHIYDCFYSGDGHLAKNSIGYGSRYETLAKAFEKQTFHNLVLVETKVAKDMGDIEALHTHYTNLSSPYEGIMLRNKDSPYKQQGRSKDLLKYKKFHDDEFVVIGHHEGTGAHKGTPIFECSSKAKEGKTFSVTMHGTIDSRKQMLEHVKGYYGKLLTVKYQEISADGAPRFPVGICFRDYE
jgi:ATP-dependent DNA ligase